MGLDERTSRPLYRQVADELRVQIQQRELTPGRQLPTEARMMARYGVSRNTVRLALGVLRTEGLVVTGQGRGSFVADLPEGRPARAGARVEHTVEHSFDDAFGIELAGDADGDELTVTTQAAPPYVAERLGIQPGDRVIVRHRLGLREGAPSHLTDSFTAADVVGGSSIEQPGPLRVGLASELAELGHPLARLDDEVGVRMPTPSEAQELQIATGVPVLTVLRTAFDESGTPVLAMTALLPGDRHVVRYGMTVSVIDEGGAPSAERAAPGA